ncbi:SPOR domain-containing protein [Dechloromonas sp. XY25]|uniref:SPOR domain-containing protein n=1 Tax=Dechloromonas hankyongensis TaxID=2908002 RepID=A0ABS9JWT9_9RHOO|nr:SPOR domain-containing protein [Dechloromonas hankyongensis]MCG2575378.1 SPOR domain-containing protein [Dechloromonas hankyongensis]
MKVLVFLLVLANLLFYAFTAGYFGRPDNPDAGRGDQQITPERLRIMSRGEAPSTTAPARKAEPVPENAPAKPEAEPAPAPAPAATSAADEAAPKAELVKETVADKPDNAPACLAWRQLTVAEADKIAALMGKRFADYKLSRKIVAGESNGWWVYIPSLPGKPEADKKAGELRDLGVTDFFIVQDGTSRHAISLGIFSSEKGGNERLAELKAKGVRSAVMGPRPSKDTFVALQAKGPGAKRPAVIAAVAEAIQKNEALACK